MQKFLNNKLLIVIIGLLVLCSIFTFLIFHTVKSGKSDGVYSESKVNKYIETLGSLDSLRWQEQNTKVTDEEVNSEIKSILNSKGETELTDEVVQKISNVKTVAEYKKQVKENLERNKEITAVEGAKQGLLYTIVDETTFKTDEDGNILLPEDEVERLYKKRMDEYAEYAKSANMSLEDFCTSNLGKSLKDVQEELKSSVKGTVKFNLVVSALVAKFDINVTNKDMNEFANTYLKNVGMTEEQFEKQYNQSFIEYYGEENLRDYLYQDKVMDELVSVAKKNSSKKDKN